MMNGIMETDSLDIPNNDYWFKVIEMIRFLTVIVKKGFGKYVEKSLKMSVNRPVKNIPNTPWPISF